MSRPTNSSRPIFRTLLCLGLMSTAVFELGCSGDASGPTAEGAKLVLDAEPSDVTGVLELKSAMITGIASMDGQATVVGRVVSGQDWETDQATFLVRDLQADTAHDHGEGDHSDCAFCQAKEKDTGSMALVHVVNAEGETIRTDARKLLGLNEDQVVVAQGSGTIDEDGTLVFVASKVFIRE